MKKGKISKYLIKLCIVLIIGIAGGYVISDIPDMWKGNNEEINKETGDETNTESNDTESETDQQETVEAETIRLEEETQNEEKETVYKVALFPGYVKGPFDESAQIPIAPDSEEMKPAFSEGPTGPVTGVHEYDINMGVARVLEEKLQNLGYDVYMCKNDTTDVKDTITCTTEAYEEKSDILVAIYCRKRQDLAENGAMVYEATEDNPYVGNFFTESNKLANSILNYYCQETAFKNSGIYYDDKLAGVNWSKMPAVQVMLGCLNNEEDEKLLADETYWDCMATGLARGIDAYFKEKETAGSGE